MEIRTIRYLSIKLFSPALEPLLDCNFWELYCVSFVFEPHNIWFDSWVVALVAHVCARFFWSHRQVKVKGRNITSLRRSRLFFHPRVKWGLVSLLHHSHSVQLRILRNTARFQLPLLGNRCVHHWAIPLFSHFTRRSNRAISVKAALLRVHRIFDLFFVFELWMTVHSLTPVVRVCGWSLYTFLVQNRGDFRHSFAVNLVKVLRCRHLGLNFGWIITFLRLRLKLLFFRGGLQFTRIRLFLGE